MSKQNSVVEQIKAKAKVTRPLGKKQKDYVDWIHVNHVEEIFKPLMAHLQPENRPSWNQPGGASGKDFDDWFEELDKLKLGKVDVVCIKRKLLQDVIEGIPKRGGCLSNREFIKDIEDYGEQLRKELLDKGDAPQKELKK